ncbi:hypothetical protein JOF34_001065 [Microbacterium amylolyticum]|uniref:Uncharacterized protein n=1 Tax=Microbacterium amylolyticum TaxID=936337 RepID=A0ABS4ZGR6_9MICO|nr:hypothetical protein [Microbacterium amylolyticum]
MEAVAPIALESHVALCTPATTLFAEGGVPDVPNRWRQPYILPTLWTNYFPVTYVDHIDAVW